MNKTGEEIRLRRNRIASRRAELPIEKQAAFSQKVQTGIVTERPSLRIGGSRQNDEPVPISPSQEPIWNWEQLNPGSSAYNISVAGELQGCLRTSLISQCLNEIVRRHESLRTNFVQSGGLATQVITPPIAQELLVVDLHRLSELEWKREARRLASEHGRRPFNLTSDALLRVAVVGYEAKCAVLRTMHHIVSDLWSSNIFMRELGTLYDAFGEGAPSPLAELPLQYADYTCLQRKRLAGQALQAELSYWKEQLSGLEPLDLPIDRPRNHAAMQRAASEGILLPKKLTEELTALAQAESATLSMVLLATAAVLLSRYSGQQDIALGTLSSGRNHIEAEPLIGFFLNTLIIRTKISAAQSFRSVLRQLRETYWSAEMYEDLPFHKLLEELKPHGNTGVALSQVMFVMTAAAKTAPGGARPSSGRFANLRFSALSGKQQRASFGEAKYALVINAAGSALMASHISCNSASGTGRLRTRRIPERKARSVNNGPRSLPSGPWNSR